MLLLIVSCSKALQEFTCLHASRQLVQSFFESVPNEINRMLQKNKYCLQECRNLKHQKRNDILMFKWLLVPWFIKIEVHSNSSLGYRLTLTQMLNKYKKTLMIHIHKFPKIYTSFDIS